MIEQIEASLQQNPNLTDDLRADLFELTLLFQKNFPDVRLKNLSERLKTLQIKKANKFVQKDVMQYLPLQNALNFNVQELEKSYGKHWMMFGLLQMITASGSSIGLDIDHQFEALNNGYTELLTNYLVRNESEEACFPNEFLYANIIGSIIGIETLQEAFFFNRPASVVRALEEAGIEATKIDQLNKTMNALCSMPKEDPRLKDSESKMQLEICKALDGADLTPSQVEQVIMQVECFNIGNPIPQETVEAMQKIGRVAQAGVTKTL